MREAWAEKEFRYLVLVATCALMSFMAESTHLNSSFRCDPKTILKQEVLSIIFVSLAIRLAYLTFVEARRVLITL